MTILIVIVSLVISCLLFILVLNIISWYRHYMASELYRYAIQAEKESAPFRSILAEAYAADYSVRANRLDHLISKLTLGVLYVE